MSAPMDFEAIRRAVATIGDAIQTRLAQREALALERDRVAALPMHRADLVEAVGAWIDSTRPLYAKQLAESLKPRSRKPDRPLPEARSGDFGLLFNDGKLNPMAVFALLGDPLKRSLSETIRELDLDDADALPAEQRRATLADLDGRIEAMDAEIEALNRQAEQAGLVKIRRQPTREEIEAYFSHGRPSDPVALARELANLERAANGEPPVKAPPLPATPSRFIPDRDLPNDF